MQFQNLPQEIKTKIFEYDRTGKDQFEKTIHHLKFIPVLHVIVFWKSLFGENWYKSHLYSYKYRKQYGFPPIDSEMSRRKSWDSFRKTKLK